MATEVTLPPPPQDETGGDDPPSLSSVPEFVRKLFRYGRFVLF